MTTSIYLIRKQQDLDALRLSPSLCVWITDHINQALRSKSIPLKELTSVVRRLGWNLHSENGQYFATKQREQSATGMFAMVVENMGINLKLPEQYDRVAFEVCPASELEYQASQKKETELENTWYQLARERQQVERAVECARTSLQTAEAAHTAARKNKKSAALLQVEAAQTALAQAEQQLTQAPTAEAIHKAQVKYHCHTVKDNRHFHLTGVQLTIDDTGITILPIIVIDGGSLDPVEVSNMCSSVRRMTQMRHLHYIEGHPEIEWTDSLEEAKKLRLEVAERAAKAAGMVLVTPVQAVELLQPAGIDVTTLKVTRHTAADLLKQL